MVNRVVMAKFPQPGRVKTRLTPELSPPFAAMVHQVLLLHVTDRLPAQVVCFDPPESQDAFRRLLGPALHLLPQVGGDLGNRLAAAHQSLSATGAASLFFGVDSPDLPADAVETANNLLTRAEVVVGPTEDGGFWCVGLQSHVDAAALFHNIRWSSGHECQDVQSRAAELGLTVALAPAWDDVDYAADLIRLLDRLASSADPADRHLYARLEPLVQELAPLARERAPLVSERIPLVSERAPLMATPGVIR